MGITKQTAKLLFVFSLIIGFLSCNNENSVIEKGTAQEKIIKKALQQRIEDRMEQEKEMTKDPYLGYVPKKELIKARKKTKNQLDDLLQKTSIPNVVWNERGPNNVGGRTRGIMFDPNDAQSKKVWSGGVGGGLWYSNDITASSANWQKVDDFWSNMAISSMDHDPVNKDLFYVGTGEGFNNADAIDGDGIWKSTDGGSTWSQMANTTSFNDCNKIICFKASHILVATNNGLRLSTDAGASWSTPRSGSHADVAAAANGDLYAGNFSGDIYKSTDDGATWTTSRSGTESRVELATAPSDANYVYALINSGSNVSAILQSTDAGSTWNSKTIPLYKEQGSCAGAANVFTRGQGWYDLIALVSPTDRNKIIIGGVDLFRSEDGGSTWGSISYWTGACDAYVHADQHALVSRPGFPNEIVSGNDGGVYYSSNAFSTGSNPAFNTQNENYNITQFYAVAIHPTAGSDYMLAGAQDNGTKKLNSPGIGAATYASGGDGAFCHIDQDQPNYQISSYVYNNYYISTNGSNFSSYSIGNTGRFINPTDYDNDSNTLYAAKNSNEYLRVSGIGGTLANSTVSVSGFGNKISAVRVSRNVANRVYFGIGNGRICYVDNAHATPTFVDLGIPVSGYVSSIDVEDGNESHLIATYSNYGINSVWESTNGGANWTAVEGDLPNFPVRWGIFDPNNADQVVLGTELGVWTTDNLNGASTDWDPTNSGLANTRVDMIEYRTSDNMMAAATHGRGVFTSTSFNLGCNIGILTAGAQICDPVADTYTQEVTVTLNNTPASGQVTLGGQNFSFPFSQPSTTQTYTLVNLPNDGQQVDLAVSFTASPGCSKTVVNAFSAPNSGCLFDNEICANAFSIAGTGTYTTNGPSTGNGCSNCSSSTHADWWKWTAPTNGTIEISSCLKGVDTRFWLYSGDCISGLTQIGGNDDECAMTTNGNAYASYENNINVVAGTSYYIEWDDRWSSAGFDFDFTFVSSGGCPTQDYIHVDPQASGNSDGCTWADAYKNLQDAIDAAVTDPMITTIWVKSGTYFPGATGTASTRFSSFTTSEDVSILGGFAGTETLETQRDYELNPTILSGDIGTTGVYTDNSYHVVDHSGAHSLTLDGLSIERGNANISPNLQGGGVRNSGAIVLKNCTFKDNYATTNGAAIFNTGSSASCMVEDVMFQNNGASPLAIGSGAELVVLANSDFTVE